jgi:hypothetical protein
MKTGLPTSVSEDRDLKGLDARQLAAVQSFQQRIEAAYVARYGADQKPGSFFVGTLEETQTILDFYFRQVGDRILMGSRDFLVDRLTAVKRIGNALLLLGDESGSPDAHGYLVSPCSTHFLHANDPLASLIALDNRLLEDGTRKPKRERRIDFKDPDTGADYTLVDLITAKAHLLLFPHGSAYVRPRYRNKLLQAYRKTNPVFCPNHNP